MRHKQKFQENTHFMARSLELYTPTIFLYSLLKSSHSVGTPHVYCRRHTYTFTIIDDTPAQTIFISFFFLFNIYTCTFIFISIYICMQSRFQLVQVYDSFVLSSFSLNRSVSLILLFFVLFFSFSRSCVHVGCLFVCSFIRFVSFRLYCSVSFVYLISVSFVRCVSVFRFSLCSYSRLYYELNSTRINRSSFKEK